MYILSMWPERKNTRKETLFFIFFFAFVCYFNLFVLTVKWGPTVRSALWKGWTGFYLKSWKLGNPVAECYLWPVWKSTNGTYSWESCEKNRFGVILKAKDWVVQLPMQWFFLKMLRIALIFLENQTLNMHLNLHVISS